MAQNSRCTHANHCLNWNYKLRLCESSRLLDNAKLFSKVVVLKYTSSSNIKYYKIHPFGSCLLHPMSPKFLNFFKLNEHRMSSHCRFPWHFQNYKLIITPHIYSPHLSFGWNACSCLWSIFHWLYFQFVEVHYVL